MRERNGTRERARRRHFSVDRRAGLKAIEREYASGSSCHREQSRGSIESNGRSKFARKVEINLEKKWLLECSPDSHFCHELTRKEALKARNSNP